jgi:hypothetical protein
MESHMTKNVGTMDRVLRGIAAAGLAAGAVLAPWPVWVRVVAFGVNALYLAYTALGGTCVGYRLLGHSTCAVENR